MSSSPFDVSSDIGHFVKGNRSTISGRALLPPSLRAVRNARGIFRLGPRKSYKFRANAKLSFAFRYIRVSYREREKFRKDLPSDDARRDVPPVGGERERAREKKRVGREGERKRNELNFLKLFLTLCNNVSYDELF